jgi:thiosulfate/3-mercaptopyruvate sulfurtransferase
MKKDLPLVSPKEVPRAKDPDIVIVDARSGPDAYQRYKAGHLAGAQHIDLDLDLSDKPHDPAKGGRHPLPAIEKFGAALGRLGITPSTRVYVYDDKSGANAAARFWWMLKAAGHLRVQVIDGGLDALVREGLPVTDKQTEVQPAPAYPVKNWMLPSVTLSQVARDAADPDKVVIDVRESYRYRGEREPIDLVAGHIPGAVNVPYLQNINDDGYFLSPDKLADLYKSVIGDRTPGDVIVHCGSGVTACHTLLALEQAGLPGASLYVGSWSEWSRNDRPVGKAEKY